ncbi:MvdC/MvdD family ATP grasp protein [Streptomyces nondiastaticus]|uniref:MvdC/MvdD family ATP grasp protein n=1 Tax=Streptomyces nondiastaticus TaxID=3154512 RepID=UPI003435831A
MDGRPVLVCTQDEDATADLVIAELNQRRVPVIRFDPGQDFPALVVLAARTGAGGWGGRLAIGQRTADLSAVRALYHRRPSTYAMGGGGQAARFAAQENRRVAVPATLITNDAVEAKAFCAEQPAIYKPLHAAAYHVAGEACRNLGRSGRTG